MKTTHVLAAIIAGLAAGAVVGVLYAPDKGSKTRSRLTDAGASLSEKLKDGFADVIDSVMGKYDDVKDKFAQAKDDYNDLKEDVKDKKGHYAS